MAPDECFQHGVTPERHNAAIVRIRLPVAQIILGEPVVEVGSIPAQVDAVEFRGTVHLAQIPQFHHLVFPIRQHVAPVAFAVDVRQALGVADEDAGFAAVGHGAAVPHAEGLVVGSAEEDVWGGLVAEADGVDVVGVFA